MICYQSRELMGEDGRGTGLWRYTVESGNIVRAVGYCADDCPGHPTEEGAREHYKEFMLDKHLELGGMHRDRQRRCKVCDTWTQKFARVDDHHFSLCEEHCSRAEVAKLYKISSITFGC